jgi:hypothetical protein
MGGLWPLVSRLDMCSTQQIAAAPSRAAFSLLALVASGVPLPAVSARLGHGSIRTTQEIYSHMIHGQDDAAARKREEFQNRTTVGSALEKVN